MFFLINVIFFLVVENLLVIYIFYFKDRYNSYYMCKLGFIVINFYKNLLFYFLIVFKVVFVIKCLFLFCVF